MSGIYKGPSEGAAEVIDGYEDYAKAIIASRSIPDIRDGLKKVQRRIIYTAWKIDKGHLIKCSTMVGRIMEIHPHGDGSIYGALCLLSDENGGCTVPYFHGDGNLGKVYLSDKPAAMRYPTAMINDNGKDFFRDKEIMELVPSEEGDGKEPPVLLAPYPTVLVNGANGIAVTVGTKMPSFNFDEVIDLTVKCIKEGLTVSDVIKPDFPTGGVLVSNDQELTKIMLTGKGKLKIRAKVEIVGKEIHVLEVPYGKTVQSIIKSVKNLDSKDIVNASDATGRDSNFLVRIECKTKRCVEHVLMELYSKNILQNTFASSILVVDDGKPLILGVHDIIKRWLNWRKSVLQKKFDLVISNNENRCNILDYFIRLCSVEEQRDTYISTLINQTDHDADTYLRSVFPDIPEEVVSWIRDRKVSAFRKAGKYQREFEQLQETISLYKHYKEAPEDYIVKELLELKQMKAGRYPRHTEITYQDYKFSKISDSSEIEDTSYCVYTLYEDGFMKKTRNKFALDEERVGILCEIQAQANSVLIGFDNCGRLLRVSGKEIPFTGYKDNGVYLPKYFDVPSETEGYRVLYMCLVDGSQKMLLYKDGYVGFLDTSEFEGKKNIKIIQNGVSTEVAMNLLHVFEQEDIPMALLVGDDTGNKLRVGVCHPSSIPVRSRTSRAKVFTGNSDMKIEYFYPTEDMELMSTFPMYQNYMGKLKVLRDDINGDIDLVEGRYNALCDVSNFE